MITGTKYFSLMSDVDRPIIVSNRVPPFIRAPGLQVTINYQGFIAPRLELYIILDI